MNTSIPTLVWVSVFSSPGQDPLLKPFYESIQHAERPTSDQLNTIVRNSFEAAGFTVTKSIMAPSLSHCVVCLTSDDYEVDNLIVAIKTQPALSIDGTLFRLEEFEI